MRHIIFYVTGQNSSNTTEETVHIYWLVRDVPRKLASVRKGFRDYGQAVIDTLKEHGLVHKDYPGSTIARIENDRIAKIHQL